MNSLGYCNALIGKERAKLNYHSPRCISWIGSQGKNIFLPERCYILFGTWHVHIREQILLLESFCKLTIYYNCSINLAKLTEYYILARSKGKEIYLSYLTTEDLTISLYALYCLTHRILLFMLSECFIHNKVKLCKNSTTLEMAVTTLTCGISSSCVTLTKFSNMATIEGAAITWQFTRSDRKRTYWTTKNHVILLHF